jgi:hypothetical protein
VLALTRHGEQEQDSVHAKNASARGFSRAVAAPSERLIFAAEALAR